MTIKVTHYMYGTLGNVAHTLNSIANISRAELLELLKSGSEAPTDGVGLIRIAALLSKIFELDGLVTHALIQKLEDNTEQSDLHALLRKPLKERIKHLYEHVGKTSPLGTEPFQTAIFLAKLRDRLVHPGVEEHEEERQPESARDLFDALDGFLVRFYEPNHYRDNYEKLEEVQRILMADCEVQHELSSATAS